MSDLTISNNAISLIEFIRRTHLFNGVNVKRGNGNTLDYDEVLAKMALNGRLEIYSEIKYVESKANEGGKINPNATDRAITLDKDRRFEGTNTLEDVLITTSLINKSSRPEERAAEKKQNAAPLALVKLCDTLYGTKDGELDGKTSPRLAAREYRKVTTEDLESFRYVRLTIDLADPVILPARLAALLPNFRSAEAIQKYYGDQAKSVVDEAIESLNEIADFEKMPLVAKAALVERFAKELGVKIAGISGAGLRGRDRVVD